MSDANLLALGAAITFIGLSGAYAYLRESFLAGQDVDEQDEEIEPSARRAQDVA